MIDGHLMPDPAIDIYYDYINDFQNCQNTDEECKVKAHTILGWVTMNRHLLKRPDVENTWEEVVSDGSPLHESLCYIG